MNSINNKAASAVISLMGLLFVCGAAGAADVLDIGVGAKSIAMGRTFTSVKADGYGIFGNPASLTGIRGGEVVSMYGQMDDFSRYTMLGYALPLKYGTIFAGYANNQVSDLTATALDPATGRPKAISTFDFRNDLFLLGYEQRLSGIFSCGARVKYASMGSPDIGQVSSHAVNADAGVLAEVTDRFTLGLSANNLIPGDAGAYRLHNGQTEEQPFTLAVGAGYAPHQRVNVYADLSCTKDMPVLARLGTEWRPKDIFALRGGVEQMSSGWGSTYYNASVGAGFNVGSLTIDYAYYYDTLIAANSRNFISLTLRTAGFSAAKPAASLAQTPKAEPAAPVAAVEVSSPAASAVPVEASASAVPAVPVEVSSPAAQAAVVAAAPEDAAAVAERIAGQIVNVYFRRNSAEFVPLCLALAEMNADYLKGHPDLKVTIEVYGDRTGSEAGTRRLNEKRAARLRDVYLRCGIAPERIIVVIHGKLPRTAPSYDPRVPARNRRAATLVIVN